MRMSLAFRAVSCTLAVIANYSGQNLGLEIWRNCNVTWIAFVFQILHINFGHSRWTDTIRCSNIGDLRSRIPTPGFICLYIIMSLQAKMAAESIQDADLSFLSNYVHHSNWHGFSSFKRFAGEKGWSNYRNNSVYEHIFNSTKTSATQFTGCCEFPVLSWIDRGLCHCFFLASRRNPLLCLWNLVYLVPCHLAFCCWRYTLFAI